MTGLIEIIMAAALMRDLSIPVENYSPAEVACLAENIYHEARGEPLEGREAVAHVTLNRVADPRWPDTICGVVWQPHQFSWTATNPPIKEPAAYERALMVAVSAITGLSDDPTGGATHYFDHNRVNPRWSRRLERVAVIGGHTFLE